MVDIDCIEERRLHMSYTFRPTWAEINLDHVRANYKNIRALLKPETKFCAVIKANACSHGAIEYAKVYEQEGADYFALATCEEAMELRQNGITKTPMMCLGFVPEDRYKEMMENNIDITLYSYEKAVLLSKAAKENNLTAKVHIKLDTGMTRLGFQCTAETVEEILKISKLDNMEIIGVFTHFARADETDPSYTREQYKNYDFVVSELESRGFKIPIKHVCNSAGTMMFPEYHLDMVRPGIILSGHYPSDDVDKSRVKLYPVMTLKSTIAHVKKVQEGRGISYGHKYHSKEDEIIATMPIGYADGFTRMLSGQVEVKVNGKMVPVVGRICMDQCMLSLDEEVEVGTQVTIFSDEEGMDIERFGKVLGTINYELLCMVHRRVPRVYKEDGKIVKVLDYLL